MEKIVYVTVTEYEGDDFPEASSYIDFVAERLASIYRGIVFDVSFGLRDSCSPSFEDADDVVSLCRNELWDEFAEDGYTKYS